MPKSTNKNQANSTKKQYEVPRKYQSWYCWVVGVRSEGCEEGECGRNQWWPASPVGYTPPGLSSLVRLSFLTLYIINNSF